MPFDYYTNGVHHMLTGTTYGRTVIWDDPPGDKFAPYKDPTNSLAYVTFCSDFSYYAKAPGFPQDIPITHSSVAADTGTTIGAGYTITSYTSVTDTDITLCAHNLPYIPTFMVAINGIQYPSGCPIQVNGNGSRRFVTFWADATNIYVRDSARPSTVGLSSISVTYHVTVFRDRGKNVGVPLFYASASRVRLGYGKVDSADTVIRDPITGDLITYIIPAGSVMDVANGRPRWILSNGTIFDIGPLFGLTAYNSNTFFGAPSKVVAIP